MRVISDLAEYEGRRSAVAVGKFDGVHLGHRKLIGELVRSAREQGLVSVAFTFDPPPAVLFGGADAKLLLSKEEQQAVLARLGVEVLVAFPFTRETAAMPPETFLREILSKKLHAARIVCGDDVSFGADGRGDLALLRAMAKPLDYDVLVVEKLTAHGAPVSSTRIREALRAGREAEAREMMGE